jgi:hypothetical protein
VLLSLTYVLQEDALDFAADRDEAMPEELGLCVARYCMSMVLCTEACSPLQSLFIIEDFEITNKNSLYSSSCRGCRNLTNVDSRIIFPCLNHKCKQHAISNLFHQVTKCRWLSLTYIT